MKKICHITTAHSRKDVRIYLKELRSLAKPSLKLDCTLIVADGEDSEYTDNISTISIGRPSNSVKRIFFYPLKMLRKALKVNAEIYHIHDPELFWIVLPLKIRKKKVVLDLHEDLPSQILSKHYLNRFNKYIISKAASLYEYLLFPSANAIVTATPYIAKINNKLNLNVVCVCNYPIQTEFNNNRSYNDAQLEKSVCYTGGITSIRGVDVLIDCVLESKENWVLHLAGPINEEFMRVKLDNALKNTNRIKYWGNVSREVLSTIFAQSSAGFVTFLPVPNHINAIPNKMFEYMSSGLPIICSNFEEWNEIINGNQVGMTVDPKSKEEIIKSVNFILDNPTIARAWGENGIEAIKNKFNWETESLKLIELYNNL